MFALKGRKGRKIGARLRWRRLIWTVSACCRGRCAASCVSSSASGPAASTFAPHTGTVSAFAFLAATGFYGMSLGGHSQDFAQTTTTAVGFAIEDVKVSGNDQTSEIDILQQLGLDGTTSLVALDIDVARAS